MLKNKFQRDEFISKIYSAAQKKKNIFFLSADFGAPALDNFRLKLKKQFLHLGICEQNMIDVACGMALEGSKVYVYAMAPFLSLRCLEQHKTATCLMDLNVCSIVTGIGLSYANSGPTHYATEDFACLRSLPNSIIFTASDSDSAKMIAEETLKINKPSFVRLDRKASKNLGKINKIEIKKGYRILKKGKLNKILVISQGTIIERALETYNTLKPYEKKFITIIDLIRAKPFPKNIRNIINKYQKIITIDEQTSCGGLGSLIRENIDQNKIVIKEFCLKDKFIFENLGREKLLDKYGLSRKLIKKALI